MVTFYHIDDLEVLSSATKPVVIPVTIECRDCEETCKYRKRATTTTKRGRDLRRRPVPMEKNKRQMMFKYEDVRRDYLVSKIIEMMDLTLRRGVEGYDTECVTYQVVPTSIHGGFVEFVEGALTISDVNHDDYHNLRTIFDQSRNQPIRKVSLNTLAFWNMVTSSSWCWRSTLLQYYDQTKWIFVSHWLWAHFGRGPKFFSKKAFWSTDARHKAYLGCYWSYPFKIRECMLGDVFKTSWGFFTLPWLVQCYLYVGSNSQWWSYFWELQKLFDGGPLSTIFFDVSVWQSCYQSQELDRWKYCKSTVWFVWLPYPENLRN